MSSKGRYNHPVSLNQEQEDLVNSAREINKDVSYADLVVIGAELIITKNKKK